jgi:uncharacterized membrane protein YphA (DoxX/SURF4 family)
LQRFFSTFPAGWPGVGLLVLRLAAGSIAIGEGLARFEQARPSLNLAAAAVGIGAGSLLLAGFLTPFAGATLAVLNTSIALFWIAPVHSAPNSLFVAAVDAALAFLGPGFVSIDARLFGRHRVIIPRTRK